MEIFLNYITLGALPPTKVLVFKNHDIDCITMKVSYIVYSKSMYFNKKIHEHIYIHTHKNMYIYIYIRIYMYDFILIISSIYMYFISLFSFCLEFPL